MFIGIVSSRLYAYRYRIELSFVYRLSYRADYVFIGYRIDLIVDLSVSYRFMLLVSCRVGCMFIGIVPS